MSEAPLSIASCMIAIGSLGARLAVAVDQHRVEDVAADEAAQFRLQPVVGAGDGARLAAQAGRQDDPDQDEIAVAGVVGEIDPALARRLVADPDAAHRCDESREQCDRDGENRNRGPARETRQVPGLAPGPATQLASYTFT